PIAGTRRRAAHACTPRSSSGAHWARHRPARKFPAPGGRRLPAGAAGQGTRAGWRAQRDPADGGCGSAARRHELARELSLQRYKASVVIDIALRFVTTFETRVKPELNAQDLLFFLTTVRLLVEQFEEIVRDSPRSCRVSSSPRESSSSKRSKAGSRCTSRS